MRKVHNKKKLWNKLWDEQGETFVRETANWVNICSEVQTTSPLRRIVCLAFVAKK